MMDISGIISSLFSKPYLYLATLAIVLLLIFTGKLKLSFRGLKIGTDEKERLIIGRQTRYVENELAALASTLLREHPDFDPWRTKYICEKVLDEFVRAIYMNHITDTEGYIDDRYETILTIVQQLAEKDYFWNEEFKKFLKDNTERMVRKLYKIRKEMN